LQETLTFNPQEKAYLYTRLAKKRLEEIKNILTKREGDQTRLSIARERLVTHLIKAEQIVAKELAKGKDGQFAEKITAELNISREEAKKLLAKEEYQSKAIETLESEQKRFEKEIEAKEETEKEETEAEETKDNHSGDLNDEEGTKELDGNNDDHEDDNGSDSDD